VAPLPAVDAYKSPRTCGTRTRIPRAATNSGLLNIMREKGDAGANVSATRGGQHPSSRPIHPNDTRCLLHRPLKTTQAWNSGIRPGALHVMIAAVLRPTGIPRILPLLR